MFKYGYANRYDDPRSLDFGTGAPAARDQWRSGSAASTAMWKRDDPNRSPVNWLLARQQPELYQEPAQPPTGASKLLNLPYELRILILEYALPRTISYRPEVAWHLGSVAILRVCKQLHEEGSPILYSNNTFRLDVLYDCCRFSMLSLLPMSSNRVLHVRRQTPFPESLSKRNVALVRRLDITVHHVDSYTGAVKYGYGGGGLTEGLKTQVAFLCQTLRRLPVIEKLEICYQCQDVRVKEETQVVLEPFLGLKNVRCVSTSGHVSDKTSATLKSTLFEARQRALAGRMDQPDDTHPVELKRPPNLETNVKKGLALYRGYDDRDI